MKHAWDSTPKNDRFDVVANKPTMKAIVTMNSGGMEQLCHRVVRRPEVSPGSVLIKVLAAGINNTEINTRLGWYSKQVKTSTEATEINRQSTHKVDDGGWNETTPFPFIQGTDCCGEVVACGLNVDQSLLNKRVLVRACMRTNGFDSMESVWLGSDFDGAFAQYVAVSAKEVFEVTSHWSDVELASIPCAYGTAENMVHRAAIQAGERVLIVGASGGVGSAAIQLVKRTHALVSAITSSSKQEQIKANGADTIMLRDDPHFLDSIEKETYDVVVDNVGGPMVKWWLHALKRGGRYVTSGAIGGPMVEMDMRTLYLKDITLLGCTAWDEAVFFNIVSYIENDEIKPLVAKTFQLEQIKEAQQAFLKKEHVGKFVLIPPQS